MNDDTTCPEGARGCHQPLAADEAGLCSTCMPELPYDGLEQGLLPTIEPLPIAPRPERLTQEPLPMV